MEGQAQEPRVVIVSESTVKPASATPVELRRMCLPAIDIWWIPGSSIRRVLFYRMPRGLSLDIIVQSLEASLAKVLVDFYPVAARLVFNPHTSRPEFDCNDSGVKFLVATVDFPFCELDKDECAYRDWFDKLAPQGSHLTHFASHPDAPLLSLQVTGFEGAGGFCIGVAFHHVLGDGKSLWHFMNSWSQLCRGLPEISAKPHHARSFFLDREPGPPPAPAEHRHLDYRWVDANMDNGVQLCKLVPTVQQRSGAVVYESKEFPVGIMEHDEEKQQKKDDDMITAAAAAAAQTRTFHITADLIARLRRATEAPSSYVAVAAHAWRCMLASRGMEAEARVVFMQLVDCRARVTPRLPAEYFGNCVVPALVSAPAREVIEAEGRKAVRTLEKMVEWYTREEYVCNALNWLSFDPCNAYDRFADFVFRKSTPAAAVNGVVSWHRFPCYDTDFGWGPPVAVPVPRLPGPGAIVFAPPRGGRDGMEVMVKLPPQQMQDFARQLLLQDHDVPSH